MGWWRMSPSEKCKMQNAKVKVQIVRRAAVIALGLMVIGSVRAYAQDVIAVKAGKIITVSGATIENGVVLIRGGKIAAVGKSVEIPAGAKVLEAAVVMPGMVEAHSARGMD